MSPLIVENGKLDVKSVECLAKEELRQWISDRLHGRDDLVPGDVRQGEMPYYLFVSIYSQLDRHVRQDIEQIVAGFIRNMAYNRDTDWHGDAADALLLLAQTIKDDTITDELVEMARSHRFLNGGEPALHYRLLQTLVALNWRGSIIFWQEEAKAAPERCTGVAIGGLALIAPEHAIDLLPLLSSSWTAKVENQVLIGLADLISRCGEVVVLPKLSGCLPQMTDTARTAIREFLHEEGIALPSEHRGERAKRYFRDRDSLRPISLALGNR